MLILYLSSTGVPLLVDHDLNNDILTNDTVEYNYLLLSHALEFKPVRNCFSSI